MQQVGFEHWTGCSHSWSHEWQTQSLRCFTHCQNVVDRKLRRAEVEEKEQMLLAWDPACLLPCCFTCSFWDDQIFVVSAPLRAWYFSYSLHMFAPFSLRLDWGKESLGKFAHDRGAADGRNMHAFIGWCPPDPSYLQGFFNWFLLDSDQSTFCALDCLAGLKAQEEYRCAKLWQKRETEGKNCF